MQKTLPFKPLKKARLYEDVADQIKSAISKRYLKPGDRLPSERKLCEMFNVGRPTIREALRTLSVMGLIEVSQGYRGSIVKKYDISQYVEAMREQLSWLISTDMKTLQQLWEVRKYLELGIAHCVAANATQRDLKNLEQIIGKMEACKDNIREYFPLSVEFHRQVALVSKNTIFFLIWEMLHDILLIGYPPILDDAFPNGASNLLKANKTMLEAIKSKDPAAIDKAMEMHSNQESFFSPKERKVQVDFSPRN